MADWPSAVLSMNAILNMTQSHMAPAMLEKRTGRSLQMCCSQIMSFKHVRGLTYSTLEAGYANRSFSLDAVRSWTEQHTRRTDLIRKASASLTVSSWPPAARRAATSTSLASALAKAEPLFLSKFDRLARLASLDMTERWTERWGRSKLHDFPMSALYRASHGGEAFRLGRTCKRSRVDRVADPNLR